jgi:hypothetical protein
MGRRRSRAQALSALTAGGDFHPALRTSAARYERPERNYGEWRARQQGLHHGESACPHALRARLGETGTARRGEKINDQGAARIRFRFVLLLIIMAREQLWTGAALSVDGVRVQLRGFRKSHQLIVAGLLGRHGSAAGSDASDQRVSACCVRINHRI